MLGVLLADNGGLSYIFGDNKAVVDSASIPEYNLKKRHHALSFHHVREAVASKIVRYYHISGEDNPADVLTKFLPHYKWWPLMKPFLHWLDMDDNGKPHDESNGGGCQQEQHKECGEPAKK